MMFRGYAIIEELFTAAVLAGGLMAIWRGAIPRRTEGLNKTYHWIFFFFMAYLAFQGLRGVLVLDDWRLVRWVIYFSILAVLLIINSKWAFPIPGARESAFIVAGSAVLYLALYMAHGLFTEQFREISRWDVQGFEWSGSAYAMFPIVLAIPAAFVLLTDSSRNRRWLGWGTIILVLLAASYYQSRVTSLVLDALLLISPSLLGFRKAIPVFILVFFLFPQGYRVITSESHTPTIVSVAPIVASRESDLDRRLMLRGALEWSRREPVTTSVFGGGFYSHRIILRPYVEELYNRHLPDIKLPAVFRTTGFPALLVDAGLFGVLWLGVIFLFAAREVFFPTSPVFPGNAVLLAALVLMLMWLAVSNILDVMLFYLAFMPSGLAAQMAFRTPRS